MSSSFYRRYAEIVPHTGIEKVDCILSRSWRTIVYKSHARAWRYQAFFFLDEPAKFWYSGLAFFNLAHTLTDITYFILHCGPRIKWSILRISPSVNHAEEFDHRHKVAERSCIIYIIHCLSCIIIQIKYSSFGWLCIIYRMRPKSWYTQSRKEWSFVQK